MPDKPNNIEDGSFQLNSSGDKNRIMQKRNSSRLNNVNTVNNRNSSKQQRHLDSEHGDDYSQ